MNSSSKSSDSQTLIVNCCFLFKVTAFMMNQVLEFMPKILGRAFWGYPLCSLLDGLLKLPMLHSVELQCKSICDATKCNWDDLCELTPDCCRKWMLISKTYTSALKSTYRNCEWSFFIFSFSLSAGNIFSWDRGIGKNLILLVCTGVSAFLLLVAIEAGAIKMIKQLIFKYIPRTYPNADTNDAADDDVLAEKERINRMGVQELKSETLAIQSASKFYGSFCAVNKFSLAIKR